MECVLHDEESQIMQLKSVTMALKNQTEIKNRYCACIVLHIGIVEK